MAQLVIMTVTTRIHVSSHRQLILRKVIEIVATRRQILRLKCGKFDFGERIARFQTPCLDFRGPTSKEKDGKER